jgi:hypothetical protein
MRTITAVALALTMVFAVASANATTHKKHRRHHAAASTKSTKEAPKDTTKEAAPKADAGKTK